MVPTPAVPMTVLDRTDKRQKRLVLDSKHTLWQRRFNARDFEHIRYVSRADGHSIQIAGTHFQVGNQETNSQTVDPSETDLRYNQNNRFASDLSRTMTYTSTYQESKMG